MKVLQRSLKSTDNRFFGGKTSAFQRGSVLAAIAAICLASPAVSFAADIINARSYVAPEHTQMIFELSESVGHNAFSLPAPDRLVIDLPASDAKTSMPDMTASKVVRRVRTGKRPNGATRIVVDLKYSARSNVALLQPTGNYGHRLVVQVDHNSGQVASHYRKAQDEVVDNRNLRRAPQAEQGRDLVVAIDAGHGGDDSGALGKRGTREKDITLRISQRIQRQVNSVPGLRGVLTRDGDYYVGLRERMAKARSAGADIFVSVHADAFRSSKVHGASVYAVSDRASTSEAARWLAKRQNASDLLGGVSLKGTDNTLASLLLDLQQSATLDSSLILADSVLRKMGKLGKLHKSNVEQAGFMVLRSPDIPSILVETAFISNPGDETRLRSRKHQDAIASAVTAGVTTYLRRYAPPNSKFAQLQNQLAGD